MTRKIKKNTSFRSPNFDHRLHKINMIVIHYTGMKSCDDALIHLCNKNTKVSAHYLIDEIGKIYQLVDDNFRAWHAGVSIWDGITDINSCSIGIELVNPGHEFGYKTFEEQQMLSIEYLLEELLFKYGISLKNVVGHSDVAPLRKCDPGELFEWERLAKKNLAIWPQKHSKNILPYLNLGKSSDGVSELQKKLSIIGYGIKIDGNFGPCTELVVRAFQRRYRKKRIDGCLDNETGSILESLLSLQKI